HPATLRATARGCTSSAAIATRAGAARASAGTAAIAAAATVMAEADRHHIAALLGVIAGRAAIRRSAGVAGDVFPVALVFADRAGHLHRHHAAHLTGSLAGFRVRHHHGV